MRARHDARGAIREIRAKLDISTAGADVELAGADAKKVISSHERKEAQTRELAGVRAEADAAARADVKKTQAKVSVLTRELAGVRAEADDAARADVKKTQAKVSVLTPSDGADVNELQTKVPVPTTSRSLVELAGADAKKVISSHERKEAQTRAVPPDEVEWARWQKCRRAGLKVMDLLME